MFTHPEQCAMCCSRFQNESPRKARVKKRLERCWAQDSGTMHCEATFLTRNIFKTRGEEKKKQNKVGYLSEPAAYDIVGTMNEF